MNLRPNEISQGQGLCKKAKFPEFGLKKANMATLQQILRYTGNLHKKAIKQRSNSFRPITRVQHPHIQSYAEGVEELYFVCIKSIVVKHFPTGVVLKLKERFVDSGGVFLSYRDPSQNNP
ncbi:hypothetical protein AVEN_208108-1 [Araneus ventricosus]|uniref:Uncharacterized protein n=1 Tax=Araneus ventricosus TaxID=182803 RepID=A0A4Y2S316_ARAVE|nr:hypothetical protein AVEN_147367-1 [Araneus ventricosus]GBN82357.1 hypothetical protein AVEN_208108-1 [Araneus ventricosus]